MAFTARDDIFQLLSESLYLLPIKSERYRWINANRSLRLVVMAYLSSRNPDPRSAIFGHVRIPLSIQSHPWMQIIIPGSLGERVVRSFEDRGENVRFNDGELIWSYYPLSACFIF